MSPGSAGEDSFVKIRFPVEQQLFEGEQYPGVDSETLWARVREEGQYEIDNSPWFVTGISEGDLVAAEPGEDSLLEFKSVIKYSGHSTVRILAWDLEEIPVIRMELRSHNCSSELSHNLKLISVDVPPEVDYSVIQEYLVKGSEGGRWDYEEAAIFEGARGDESGS